MNIRIRTDDSSLICELFGVTQVRIGDSISIDGGALVSFQGVETHRSTDLKDVILLVASVPTGATAGLLANWLWERLRARASTQVEIERTEVRLEQGEIARIIHEQIKLKR